MIMATPIEIDFKINERVVFTAHTSIGCTIQDSPRNDALRQAIRQLPTEAQNWTSLTFKNSGDSYTRGEVIRMLNRRTCGNEGPKPPRR